MTTVAIPVTAGTETPAEDAGPGCGCCVPPPDAAEAEGRRQAIAALAARREAVERRLQGLS